MRVQNKYSVFFAFLLLALLTPGFAFAKPVGAFTKVEGNVDILRPSVLSATPVRVGDPVSQGDAIRTKGNGKAEIRFLDETVLQLAPETRITIDEYSFRSANTRERGLIGLFRGKIRSVVAKWKSAMVPVSSNDSSFNVKTPTAIAGVKGTDFIVYYERGVSAMVFIEGQGFVYSAIRPDRRVNIGAGQATFVTGANNAPLAPRTLSGSLIMPLLKDLPGSGIAAAPQDGNAPGDHPGGGPQVSLLDVVVPPPANLGNNAPFSGSQGGNGTSVPITETYPQLLPTPVNLTITIP